MADSEHSEPQTAPANATIHFGEINDVASVAVAFWQAFITVWGAEWAAREVLPAG